MTIDRAKLLKRFKAALPRPDVRDVWFHDLRHTFGTRMPAQGMPMRVLQELMGDRDFKTTVIYADYAPSEREAEWVEQAFSPVVPATVDAIGTPPASLGQLNRREGSCAGHVASRTQAVYHPVALGGSRSMTSSKRSWRRIRARRPRSTSRSTNISTITRLESGSHTRNLATLQRMAAVLDEELLVCFQRTVDGEIERDFAAVA